MTYAPERPRETSTNLTLPYLAISKIDFCFKRSPVFENLVADGQFPSIQTRRSIKQVALLTYDDRFSYARLESLQKAIAMKSQTIRAEERVVARLLDSADSRRLFKVE